MIIVIGNGQSKFVVNPKQFDNHLTYGCDFVFRKYMPDHLVCQNVDAQLELIQNKHTLENKCYFKAFNLIPSSSYDMLRTTIPRGSKIGENSPSTNNFLNFFHEGVNYFIWIDDKDMTENVDWWDDDWNTDAVALRLATQQNFGETIYCVGFDYYHNQSSSGIILGSSMNQEVSPLVNNHKIIEEENPQSSFVFVGKDIDYPEFEELLNK